MAKLSPLFNDAAFINAIPANGAKVFTYQAGSSTKQTTYTDSTGTTPQSNPIVLNSRGEPASPIWLTEGLIYKFVFAPSTDSDPPVSPIRTIDNITGVNDAGITIDQWVPSGLTPTFVSSNQFTLVGDQTTAFQIGRRVKASVSSGTVYGTISASAYTSITTITLLMDGNQLLDNGLSSVSYGLLSAFNTSIPLLNYNGGQIAGNRNKLINGAMTIAQQYGNSVVALNNENKYVVDQWLVAAVGGAGTGTLNGQQVTDAPVGFKNSLKLTVTNAKASLATADGFYILQPVEGQSLADLAYGTSSAKPTSLGFWVKSSIAGSYSGLARSGTAGAYRSFVFPYTINSANTWEYKSIPIVGDPSGAFTLDNNGNFGVLFDLGSGSNTQTSIINAWQTGNFYRSPSSVNLISTLNATFQITGVQFELGSFSTPFEFRLNELQLAQKYLELGVVRSYSYASGASSIVGTQVTYKVTKRITPTVVFTSQFASNVGTTAILDTTSAETFTQYHLSSVSGPTNYQDAFIAFSQM